MRRIPVNSCLLVVLFASAVFANSNDNPYQSIVDRNVFGLRPPPPPPSNEPPKPPLPPIALTGITTILGKKMAFMNIQMPVKPGEQAKPGPTSYVLSEGERSDDIEVVSIDEKSGSVKVSLSGTITNVTFGKLPSTPAPPAVAAAGGGIPTPNNPAGIGAPQRTLPGLPTRQLRLGNNNSQGNVNGLPNPNVGVGQPGAAYDSQTRQPTAADVQASNRSAEENVLLYEANRIKNEDMIKAGAKIPRLPQHPWLGGNQGGQTQQQPQ